MKVTPPWSRRRATQPQSVTSAPACSARSSPHACVRIAVAYVDRSLIRPRCPPRGAAATSASATVSCDAVVEPAQRDGARRQLVGADDRREARVASVGHLELSFQGTFLVGGVGRHPRAAEIGHEGGPGRPGLVAERDDEHGERLLGGRRQPFVGEREQHPLEAHPEPDPGHPRAAERLGQPVVPAAAEQGRLLLVAGLLHRVRHELERGPRVVVETADERRRTDGGDPGGREALLNRLERGPAIVAEVVERSRARPPRPRGRPRPCNRAPAAGSPRTGPCARRGARRDAPGDTRRGHPGTRGGRSHRRAS